MALNNSKVLSIRVEEDMYDQIVALAAIRKVAPSMLIRELLGKGLDTHILVNQQELIKGLVRIGVDQAIKPIENRLASMMAKSAMASFSSLYMNMMVLLRGVNLDEETVMEYYNEGRKQAYQKLKSKDATNEEMKAGVE